MAGEGADGRPVVLVGVDGSEGAQAALLWAAAEAVRRQAHLEVLHAWIAVGGEPGAAKLAGDAAATARLIYPGLDVEVATPQLPAAQALLEAAGHADVLVVGPRGLGGFRGLLLGSVSHQCVEHAPGPVVVVHERVPVEGASGPASAGAGDGVGNGGNGNGGNGNGGPRVVVGVDGSPGADAALRWAAGEAAARHATLQVVYAWQFPPIGGYVAGPPEGYESVADEILSSARASALGWEPDVEVVAESRFGATVPVLIEAARGAELLVVGARGRGGFSGLLLGSTSQSCARHAPCPVAVVRPPAVAEQQAAA